jgi:hypothetical protein
MDFTNKTLKELKAICTKMGIKELSKKTNDQLIQMIKSADPSEEALMARFTLLKNCVVGNIALDREYGYQTRRQGLPEHISENIVKFIIRNYLKDKTCTWACAVGDLSSAVIKIIETKSFTSDGPTSFGPKQKWDAIYFLDARGWLTDKFILWEIRLANTHDIWKKIKVKKNQTKDEQSEEGRRPRISWDALYPQIKDHCTKVYEGTFEGIFTQQATE